MRTRGPDPPPDARENYISRAPIVRARTTTDTHTQVGSSSWVVGWGATGCTPHQRPPSTTTTTTTMTAAVGETGGAAQPRPTSSMATIVLSALVAGLVVAGLVVLVVRLRQRRQQRQSLQQLSATPPTYGGAATGNVYPPQYDTPCRYSQGVGARGVYQCGGPPQ